MRLLLLFGGAAAVVVLCMFAVQSSGGIGGGEHKHVYTKEVTKEATCTSDGEARYTCLGCNDTYTAVIPARGHKLSGDGSGALVTGTCANCGKKLNGLRYKETEVSFTAPSKTRGNRTAATAVNSRGFTYEYVIYNQKADYSSYSRYINLHGCSTCAFTTVLSAVVPEFEGFTPDKIITDVEPAVLGRSAMRANYDSDGSNGKSPLTLYGMTKIFDEYRVRYKLASSDPDRQEKEITEHLKNGDPVIVTLSSGKSIKVSRSIHTILLLGIDADGKVIIGDSVKKSRKVWGDDGLIKPGRVTVRQILDCFKTRKSWSVSEGSYGKTGNVFFHGGGDIGYILVYGDSGD